MQHSGVPRTGRFTADLVINIAGTALPVLSALLTVPLYLSVIGTPRYGVLAIAWLLVGYFGFLDFGLSRATAQALSRLAHAPASERAPILVTALALNLGLGLFGGLVLYAGGTFLLDRFFSIEGPLRAEIIAAFPWMAALLPLGMLGGIGTGALDSRERFLLANTVQGLGNVIGQVVPVIVAVLIGPSLTIVLPAVFFTRLLTLLVTLGVVARIEWPISFRAFDPRLVRSLFGYGAWVSVSSILVPVLDSFDQMLIGGLLGAAAVAHYAVPMSLAQRSQVVATGLSRTLFPRLARLDATEARQMATRAAVALAWGFGAICGPACLMSGAFLRLWVGTEFAAVATPVAEWLMVGAWLNGLAFIPYALLQGQGRPDLTAKAHLVEVVPFLGLLYGLTTQLGLPGAAMAWTLRMGADAVILFGLAGAFGRDLARGLPALVLMALCAMLAGAGPWSLPVSLLMASGAGLLFLAGGVALDPTLRDLVRRKVLRSRPGVPAPATPAPSAHA